MLRQMGSLRGAGGTQPPAFVRGGGDAGMVLLETALAIPLLILVALAGLATVRLGVDELATVAAARDGAVQAARGAGTVAVTASVQRRLPGARVATGSTGDDVWVSVTARTSVVPMVAALSVEHHAMSVAVREPGA